MSEINDKPKSNIYKQILIFIAIIFILFFRVIASTLSRSHALNDTNIATKIAKTELMGYVKSIKPSPMKDGSMVVILKDLNGKEYILSSVPSILYGIKEGDMADVYVSLGNIDYIKLVKY